MIESRFFKLEDLLEELLETIRPEYRWRKNVSIEKKYEVNDTVYYVKYEMPDNQRLYLRHSKGPRQGFFWDIYGDNMQSPALALKALLQAPIPSFLIKNL